MVDTPDNLVEAVSKVLNYQVDWAFPSLSELLDVFLNISPGRMIDSLWGDVDNGNL